MKSGINMVVDAWWGSGGKGKASAALAHRHGVIDMSSSNHPNAGHTWVQGGVSRTLKVLPAAAMGAREAGIVPRCWISPDSVFDVEQLASEVRWARAEVSIHQRAMRLSPEDGETERARTYKIASTMQGGCAATIRKMWRDGQEHVLAGLGPNVLPGYEWWRRVDSAVRSGRPFLHEVAQGTGLSINHGSHYPHCTYRDCITASGLDDLGQPPQAVGDVYMVIRTFPIRVGHFQGHDSGGWPDGSIELSWDELATSLGVLPDEIIEYTSVTRRVRRVATPSWSFLERAARINGATKLVVTFPQYLGMENLGVRELRDLNYDCRVFMGKCEEVCDAPVVAVSTGPDHYDMAWLED